MNYSSKVSTSSFLEKTTKVETIETAISFLYLTDRFVYKTKKPVNFGFCNFTTLAKRKHFCLLELQKNKLLSPKIYLGILPVHDTGNAPFFGEAKGRVVDFCVKMVRLPEEFKLANLLGGNLIDKKFIQLLSSKIYSFHKDLGPGKQARRYWSWKSISALWQQNFEQTEPFVGKILNRPTFEIIKGRVETYLSKNKALFIGRIEQGKIRDCHGDLHTGNIFVERKNNSPKPLIFDVLEFNKYLSYCDVAADLAFLTMDLKFHNRPDLAESALNKYHNLSGDNEMVESRLIDFYEVYRAYVRGKISALTSQSTNLGYLLKKKSLDEAKRYFSLALDLSRNLLE